MALRRPPTRFELKGDDIEEYNQIVREREMAKEDSHSHNEADSTAAVDGKNTEFNNKFASSPSTKKAAASQRIGVVVSGGGAHRRNAPR